MIISSCGSTGGPRLVYHDVRKLLVLTIVLLLGGSSSKPGLTTTSTTTSVLLVEGLGVRSLSRGVSEDSSSSDHDHHHHNYERKKRVSGALELAKRIRIRQQRFSKVRKQQGLAALLFPGVAPEEFSPDEPIPMWIDWVISESGQIPFNYYDLPVCPGPSVGSMKKLRKNLGAKLQGHNLTPSPYSFQALQDVPCTPLCMVQVPPPALRKLRRLVARKYRVHATIDNLPVVTMVPQRQRQQQQEQSSSASQDDDTVDSDISSRALVRGYPLGFIANLEGLAAAAQQQEEEEDNSEEEEAEDYVKSTKKRTARRNKQQKKSKLSLDEFFYFNHVKFLIFYTQDPEEYDGIRIVGFEAEPVSVKHEFETGKVVDFKSVGPSTNLKTCGVGKQPPVNSVDSLLPLKVNGEKTILDRTVPSFDVIYSYEVQWLRTSMKWEDRWDRYMGPTNPDDRVHYFSILNSLLVVLALSGVVAFFLVRTLRKDISYYNERLLDVSTSEEEDGGWKLLHGDVFRTPPQAVSALCIAVGTGLQLTIVLLLTIVTAISGILPPMGKGQLLTAVLVLYILSGSVAGYTSARLFKYFDLTGWKVHTLLTATAFPGLVMTLFLLLNICLASSGASSAVSIWTILLLFVLWVGVASPLVFVGTYFGFRASKLENPCKTKQIARHIPMDRPWYTVAPYCVIAGGLLPFFSVLLEVYFIMEAVWLHKLYYIMTFLFGVFFILITICAEISVSLCYLQLNVEDHQWHWKSFLNSASFGGYLMVYSIWFAVGKMALVGFVPTIVYFTYMSIVCLALALLCGSVGFLSSLWFVRKIYGAVKVD